MAHNKHSDSIAEFINFKNIYFLISHENMLSDFRERGREGEKERHPNVRAELRLVASHVCPNWGLNLQPTHVWEFNLQPFGL